MIETQAMELGVGVVSLTYCHNHSNLVSLVVYCTLLSPISYFVICIRFLFFLHTLSDIICHLCVFCSLIHAVKYQSYVTNVCLVFKLIPQQPFHCSQFWHQS